MAQVDFSLAIKRFRSGKCPVCGEKLHYPPAAYSQGSITGMYCRTCDARWLDGDITLDIQDGNGDIELVNDLKGIEHLPEILLALLNMKKVLPAFIGIDDRLDELIAERLK